MHWMLAFAGMTNKPEIHVDFIFPCSSVDFVAINILFSSFLPCISVYFRGKKIIRSYFFVFFRGFRGQLDVF